MCGSSIYVHEFPVFNQKNIFYIIRYVKHFKGVDENKELYLFYVSLLFFSVVSCHHFQYVKITE